MRYRTHSLIGFSRELFFASFVECGSRINCFTIFREDRGRGYASYTVFLTRGKLFPFEKAAIETLFELADGNPRTTCGIAKLALETAAVRNSPITPSIIQEVSEKRFLD